jgi:hypothetical protein
MFRLRESTMNVRHEGRVHGIYWIGSGINTAGEPDVYAVITHCDASIHVPYKEQVLFTAETVDCLSCLAEGKEPWTSTS